MKRLEPRIAEIVDQQLDAMETAGPPADLVDELRAADPVAGDLRAARRALRRPRRLPAPQRPPAGPVHSDSRPARAAAAGPRLHALAGRAIAAPPRRGHSRHAGPRARRRAHRRRTHRHRQPAAARRARDHVEHARARHAGPAAAPRPAGRGARRPRRRRPRDRGAAALAVDRAQRDSAHHHHRRRGRRRADPGRQAGVRVAAVGQSRSRLHRLTRKSSTSAAARPDIWRSATACITASAPRWRGWRCASRSPRCCAASRRSRSPRTSTMCSSGRSTSSTG